MIDSSYVNASDPNSMRDLGMTRNAVYNWTIKDRFKNSKSKSYQKYLIPKGKPTNQSFYGFGGKSQINEFIQNEVISPQLLSSDPLEINTDNFTSVR